MPLNLPQQKLLNIFWQFMIRLLLMMVFLSNKGTVGTDTMPSKLHKASLQSFHHKGKHMLNFIALRKINSNSKNEQTTQD